MKHPVLPAILLSTLIMSVILTAIIYHQGSSQQSTSATVALKDFTVVQGIASVSGETLKIKASASRKTIISHLHGINRADSYQNLSFELSPSRLIDDTPLFFWRSAADGQIYSHPLEENPIDHIDLQKLKNWNGKISEYGFIFSQHPDLNWELQDLEFSSDTPEQIVRDALSGWLEFEPWAMHSVNFIYGGSARSRISPSLFIGIWTVSSLLLYGLIALWQKKTVTRTGVITILLLGWLFLDARWLFNLSRQAQVTRNSYTGKTADQINQTGIDREHYLFFQHLKNSVLPSAPRFIYVLDNGNSYFRAKTPWWLAPHNLLNIDHLPRKQYQQKGGYILILNPVPGLHFDERSQRLRWGTNSSLAVQPLYLASRGALFRIKGTDE
jgi:hypothetical protein